MLVWTLRSLRNFTIYSTDDSVISFHVLRGLLFRVSCYWEFSGPINEDAKSVHAFLSPLNLISKTNVYEKTTNYSVSNRDVLHM